MFEANMTFGRLRTSIGIAVLALGVVAFGYRFVSPDARAGRTFFEHLPTPEIRYVRLDPMGDHPLIDRQLVVRDPAEIRALLASMEGMKHTSPNHPGPVWSVAIRIGMDRGEYGGVITGTKYQGVLFSYNSEVTSGWVYQIYSMRDPSPTIQSLLAESRANR
jgi:hypothetical protein